MKIGSYGFTAENTRRSQSWVIYHNPKCSKSREVLDLLRANRIEPQIIDYLFKPLRKKQLEELLSILRVDAKELLRQKEKIFSTLTIDLSNQDQILDAIAKHPELLERPIVTCSGKGIIARPPNKVLELI